MDGLDAAQQAAQKILEESPDLSTGAARSLRAEIRRLFGRVGENGLN